MNFFFLSMGRSRSLWLSTYFTDGDATCYHEPLAHMSKDAMLRDFRLADGRARGGSGFDLVLDYEWLAENFPDAVVVKISRPFDEVMASYRRVMASYGREFSPADNKFIATVNEKFQAIDAPTIEFDSLDEEIENIEAMVGVRPHPYRRELMLNAVVNMKEMRY